MPSRKATHCHGVESSVYKQQPEANDPNRRSFPSIHHKAVTSHVARTMNDWVAGFIETFVLVNVLQYRRTIIGLCSMNSLAWIMV